MRALLNTHRWPLLVSGVFFLLLLCDSIGLISLPAITTLEQRYYDFRLTQHPRPLQQQSIAIIDIDDRTLATEGQWPWPRQKVAALIDQLFSHYQVRQAGLDITFAEPDSHNPLPFLRQLGSSVLKNNAGYQQALQQLAPDLDPDQQLANSFRHRPVILGFYLTNETSRQAGQLPPASMSADMLPDFTLNQLTNHTGFGANLPQLQTNAKGAGHFNPLADSDGVIRRIPLLEKYHDKLYESLALRMYRQLMGDPALLAISASGQGGYEAVEHLLINDYRIPVDHQLNALVPFHGPARTFAYYSASDVLHQQVPLKALQGKIVLVGTSAIGLADLRNTPVGNAYPGVEIHANLLAGLLNQSIPVRPAYTQGLEVLALSALFFIVGLLLIRSKALTATLVSFGLMAVLILLNDWIWTAHQLDTPIIRCLLLVFGLFVIFMTFGFLSESQLKRQLANRFGQYVPPEIVEKMYESPESYTTEGQHRELTVMFCDIRNFTSISEHLTPSQLTALMNLLLSELTTVVREKHLGTIDKYIGDCIMAFWGAPMTDEAHAKHAVLAAIDMQATMIKLRPTLAAQGLPPLQIGIGINTGNMVVGEMGSRYRTSYTVMGDAVNLAARLESLTKYYGVGILVTQHTMSALSSTYLFRCIDRVIVKGRAEVSTLYEPVCPQNAANADLIDEVDTFNQMSDHYQRGDFAAAQAQLQPLLKSDPDHPLYQFYAQRLQDKLSNPPSDWDGITRMDAK